MAITKQKKEEILSKLQNILKDSETIAFVNFSGLGVADTTEMRKALKAEGIGYFVAKKTLAKRALSEINTTGDMPEFTGELAVVYGEETSPAREVYTFMQKHKEKLSLLGGIFEGKYLNQEGIMEIATIPSLDVLRGMFVNLINSPIQRFAVVLDQVAQKKA